MLVSEDEILNAAKTSIVSKKLAYEKIIALFMLLNW